jgi:23S rRNA (uridine2552-2'-O)-methyltransferase
MARTKSSKAWLSRHVNDPFVREARAQGLRSRAAFKLQQLDQKEKLFRPGLRVIDLGAAPGGWSQVAAQKTGPQGVVVAIDLLEIAPMSGVKVLRGDFRDEAVRAAVREALGGPADVVVSDMLPNVSGIPSVDQANAAALTVMAIEFCRVAMKPGGVFVVKVFQGEAFSELLALMKQTFQSVVTRKPEASRDASRETYLLGRGLRPAQSTQDSD